MDLSRLKELLEEFGITQTQIAQLLKRDRAVITNLMQGKRNLKADEAVTIANFLKVPVTEILGVDKLASGFSEPAMIPFQHAPSGEACKSRHVVKKKGKYFLEVEQVSTPKMFALEVRDDSLNLSGFLPGDIVIADTERKIAGGDVVIIQHYDDARDTAETILRRYQPPMLLAHSTRAEFLPLKEKDKSVRVIAPVLKLMRFF